MDSLSIYKNIADDIELDLLWDPRVGSMWMELNPTIANFTLLVDGVERTIGNIQWGIENILGIFASGPAAVTSFQITQDNYDDRVMNLVGTHAVPGQSAKVLVV